MTIKAASVVLMVAAAMTHSSQSIAQNYPAKPVRVVVPLAPGGATDIQARVFSQKLSQSLGQTFIVDNRAGAGGLIAFNFVQQAAPDGYTLLATTPTLTIMPALYEKPSFDAMKDFEPVILMSKAPFALIANPSFPASSLKEFLAWAKANPGKLNFAIPGVGTINHLATIWMEEAGDIKTAMIPYKGAGPANQDLIAGQVHATFANVISAGPLIKSGKVRALAVTSMERSPALPDLPAFAEAGLKNYDVTAWHGWLGPRGTPRPVINTLNAEMNKVVKAPDVEKMIVDDGGVTIGGTPENFRKVIASELERWRQLVKVAGIKPAVE